MHILTDEQRESKRRKFKAAYPWLAKIANGTMTKEDWLALAEAYQAAGFRMNAHMAKRKAGIFEPVYSPFVEA